MSNVALGIVTHQEREATMASDEPAVTIDGERLTSFDVAPERSLFRLNLVDAEGKAVSVALPAGCLDERLMTLPRIVTRAMRAKYGDNSMRLVYALGESQLETAAGAERLILTLRTTDGFDVAFALSRRDLDAMSRNSADTDEPAAAEDVAPPVH
jgi:hypothetical protein